MCDHPRIPVRPPAGGGAWWLGSEPINIDRAMEPLVSLLWDAGIGTVDCCQHDEATSSAIIGFATVSDMTGFLNLVLGRPIGIPDKDPIRDRMRDWSALAPSPSPSRMAWSWAIGPEIIGDRWGFSGRVLFPPADLQPVTARVQQARTRGSRPAGLAS